MIQPFILVAVTAALTLGVLPGTARSQTITDSNLGNLSTMPGSATNYSVFGNLSQFPGFAEYPSNDSFASNPTAGNQLSVLTDVSLTHGPNAGAVYAGDQERYSFLTTPTGVAEQSGILFGSSGPDLLNISLGQPSSTFDFSNFNLFVLYGNGEGDGGVRDFSFNISLVSPSSTVLASDSLAISDTNNSSADLGVGTYEEFHITGAASGDVLQLGATGNTTYFGGISLAAVPEPSTYAMMAAGAILLGFLVRRKVATISA